MNRADDLLKDFATPEIMTRRDFYIGKKVGSIIFHPDLTDSEIIREVIRAAERCSEKDLTMKNLCDKIVYASEVTVMNVKSKVIDRLLSGDCIMLLDKIDGYLVINARKWDKRAVSEPPTETVMRGPREGFIEDLKTNLSLLERKLKSPALAIEKLQIGRVSSTNVALIYVSTIADSSIVDKIRRKLNSIDIDAIVDSHYIQQFLEEHPQSIFNQTGVTEKPDIVAAKLLEGRVAIVVDGSPMVLTLPFILVEDFHSGEDYYDRSSFSSFLRVLRYIAIIVAVILPGFYVSMQIYHYNVIPIRFLITLMNAVKGIPLPPLAEIIFVLMLFEIIREASVRMPRAVGMAMSIVGALVLGDTAVKAGMISSPAVMITALSSIALYTVPNQVGTNGLLRLIFTLVGGLGGLYGIIIGAIFLIHYLASLDSYSTPYLAPFAPTVKPDLKDALLKSPLVKLNKRPISIPNINKTRQK